jgi:two-component system OmpR family sensor kinase
MFFGLSRRVHARLLRLPIRVRVATSVAAVVFLILLVFALVVGQIDAHRQRSDFYSTVYNNAEQFASELQIGEAPNGAIQVTPSLSGVPGAVARVTNLDGQVIAPLPKYPNLGSSLNTTVAQGNATWSATNFNGYRVVTIPVSFLHRPDAEAYFQYGQPLSTVSGEIYGLYLLLFLGALIGTVLAFGAGSLVARRAIAPIAELTAAAGEIERTGDPSRTLPTPVAEDEVAELSRTLTGMLHSLTHARNQTEAMLERQRDFVADASHELRTPLTSVLANLELLVDSLRGPDREAAESALRSTQRMRRLVGDLLILARADSGHIPVRDQLDLADVVVEATSELEPAAGDHTIELDVQPSPLVGNRDDLQRVATNLIENALRHTPPGTRVTASTRTLPDWSAELVVADDGPGIDPEARATLFERFVRGAGDRGGSFGLGLAIVAAVTQAHGGTVTVDESPHGGARFTVRLPAAAVGGATPPTEAPQPVEPVEPVES